MKLRLASGVAAVPYVPFGADGADELVQAMAHWRVTYIVEDAGLYAAPSARLASSELRRTVAGLPGVEKVWEDPVTGTRVWRVLPTRPKVGNSGWTWRELVDAQQEL